MLTFTDFYVRCIHSYFDNMNVSTPGYNVYRSQAD